MVKAPQDPKAGIVRKAKSIRLLTPDEVSGMLAVKPRQLKEMARQRKIPALKLGKVWRFSEEALERWIQSQDSLDLNSEFGLDSFIPEDRGGKPYG